jgi:spermidine/putrescine transport system permease protein
LINSFLIQIGVISQPLEVLLFSPLATVITLVHIMLPFALLILVSALRDVKQDYLDAARDLGASPLQMLTKVILPMTHNGIVGSFMFTFILAAGDYITPQLLGGRDGITSGLLIANQFRSAGNWPLGAAMAVILMTLFVGVYVALRLALRVANLAPGRHYHR